MAQLPVIVCVLLSVTVSLHCVTSAPVPDGGDSPPLPGPGLSYGGIPYGSVSGNVAEFFKRQASSSGRSLNHAGYLSNGIDYSPIQQWL